VTEPPPTLTTPGPLRTGRRARAWAAGALAAVAVTGALAIPSGASTSHAGWPPNEHLVMDKGPASRHNVLVGMRHRHNWLLGGYGNDTLYGGNAGDVLWGDYHPSGWPARQVAYIYAGNGRNFIYSNDTVDYVWTGTNPGTVVHAHEGSGVINCQNPNIWVFTSHHALPHYRLNGCRHISFYSVGY
jgi:hemolysin type calcium-binding protein